MADRIAISSVVVAARPADLAAVASAIAAMPGAEIFARDPCGKLVVVFESESELQLTQTAERLAALPGVIASNLVYHHTETASDEPQSPSIKGENPAHA